VCAWLDACEFLCFHVVLQIGLDNNTPEMALFQCFYRWSEYQQQHAWAARSITAAADMPSANNAAALTEHPVQSDCLK
jgi:hypothetical protein